MPQSPAPSSHSRAKGNFMMSDDGGLTRAGDVEKSDPELEDADVAPAALGRGQRKKVANTRYGIALWEEH
ncbi:hypothetical protein K438DRAFT_1955096 [Mycena galopus ATCC 62051]|nr:hypothetical protein K438DRAFT_1993418 [Mycena galopus ATCC 62051]KAF8215106.1 hypothetical protein K438DRAFT_1955096 [Mycena galopus ATCC 62051]